MRNSVVPEELEDLGVVIFNPVFAIDEDKSTAEPKSLLARVPQA
jgi:hypothetical protein